MEKIKVAVIIRGFHNGGIEKVFESYFSHTDISGFEIHIITHMKNDPAKKKIFTEMGCQIHELSKIHGHKLTLNNFKEYSALFKQYKFDVVHNNMPDNLLPLWYAKKNNVPCRILHAHNNYTAGYEKKNPVVAKLFVTGFAFNAKNATVLVGVSRDAARSAFGEKRMKDVIILPNAIEIDKYKFSPEKREEIRRSLGLEAAYVIGHIGRYENDQKNQEFVLEILKKTLEKQPDARLLMLGEGKRLDEFKQLSKDMGISGKVVFTGSVPNVADYLQAMDVFVLPSRKEGLGIVAVEAQAAGLYCLLSDRVPGEARVTDNVEFLSIDNGVDAWVDSLLKAKGFDRSRSVASIKEHGYSIDDAADKLAEIYRSYR